MYQLKKNILPIVLPSMVEAENFSEHPRMVYSSLVSKLGLNLRKKLIKFCIKYITLCYAVAATLLLRKFRIKEL